MHAIAHWWDTFELWISSLPYVPQVALVLIVLTLTAILIVRVLTVLIDRLAGLRESAQPGGKDEQDGEIAGQRPEEGTVTTVAGNDGGRRLWLPQSKVTWALIALLVLLVVAWAVTH
ncbi:hypothetical protein P0W64_10450 [Tsukamurella sp. 8F]|uniref:hypothetical protein n=1 Tax=unclassified Tsukamurella TaxID=2633480 RepID=UPI0023B94D77|nr:MULTISPECIES: hypothetical protein [unclassified Tsukamurella]MDF0530036.1 hypothetical protein [Tsukamurella sp. 8J]MDF0587192.1 hypothetical protein [Tsukamurella sp. 8F]